jgi:polar amino acid transport system ATP-binding protein
LVSSDIRPAHPSKSVPDAADQGLISCIGLQKTFGSTRVLDSVDLSIQKGEKVCIVGPSGSGKTTLLRCLNLLVEPTEGKLHFQGRLVGEWPARHRLRAPDVQMHRRRIGMVFQHFELFPHLTALDNITLGPRHVLHTPRAEAEERALALLKRVGLERFPKARPTTLSGGQKQRVAIARALAMRPELILFDEPTSALDAEMVGEVLDLMATLASDGMTMVIVTHELEFAGDVADRIVVMEHGRIVEEGPTQSMFESPREERTREILSRARRRRNGVNRQPEPSASD